MEDDLDNLIADSLGGVQTALEGELKAAKPAESSQEWAKEAVKELRDSSKADAAAADQPLGEEFFSNLVKTFQDEDFQRAMTNALQAANTDAPGDVPGNASAVAGAVPAVQGPAAPNVKATASASSAAATSSSGSASGGGDKAEEFLQTFLKGMDEAVGSDANIEKSLSSLMTSMLSNDLVCEPMQQITEKLEPWLKSQKNLSKADRARYEGQLEMYKRILTVYSQSPDPLPDAARAEVQRLLTELHTLGQPPEEVMRDIVPKDAQAGGDASFDDFMKNTMGLDGALGTAEQDLLKKLTEDPEELTKVMKDMAEGLPEEACKQQ